MPRWGRWIPWTLLGLGLTGAVQAGLFSSEAEDEETLLQQRQAILMEVNGMARVYSTLFRLEAAAAPLCADDAHWLPGFAVASAGFFSSELRTAAGSLGYGRQARVVYVGQGSPADQAGLTPGDLILAVGEREIREDEDAFDQVNQALTQVQSEGPLKLMVQSGGDPPREAEIRFVKACNYAPHLLRSHVVNAATTGWTIHFTTGLLDFLQDDHELAAILAHEVAHSMMSHVAKKMGNELLGRALDQVLSLAAGPAGGLLVSLIEPGKRLGNMAYSDAFEMEADYVAMYVLALGGYNMERGVQVWRRMAFEFPDLTEHSYLGAHPATPERILVQALTAREIKAKVAAGAPLRPEVEQRLAGVQEGTQK